MEVTSKKWKKWKNGEAHQADDLHNASQEERRTWCAKKENRIMKTEIEPISTVETEPAIFVTRRGGVTLRLD